MRRNPIYVFENLDSIGIYNVPIGSTVQINDADTNTPGKQPLLVQVVAKDGLHGGSTIRDFLANENNYTNSNETTEVYSELEKITQNGKTGWRMLNADPNNYGEIGDKAIDLSINDISTGRPLGATGNNSFAAGHLPEASGDESVAIGKGVKAKNNASIAVGSFNEGSNTDTIMEVGIGSSDSDRKNALEIFIDGSLNAPFSDIARINARGLKALTTKEYVDLSDAAKVNINGDTMYGDLIIDGADLTLNKNNNGEKGNIRVQGSLTVGYPQGGNNSTIYFNSSNTHSLYFDNTIVDFAITKPGVPTAKIWHEANMGPNSGLNADLLDGFQPLELPISDATQASLDLKFDKVGGTITGNVDINSNLNIDGSVIIGTQLSVPIVDGITTFRNTVNINDKLDVTGGITAGSTIKTGISSGGNSAIEFSDTTMGAVPAIYWDYANDDFYVNTTTPGHLIWNDGNFDPDTKYDKMGGTITGNVNVTGTLDVSGNSTLTSVNIINDATIGGNVTIGGSTGLNITNGIKAGSGEIVGNLIVGGTINANTDLLLTGIANIGGSLNVTGATNLSNGLNVTGNIEATADITSNYIETVTDVVAGRDLISTRAVVVGVDSLNNSSLIFTDQVGSVQPTLYWNVQARDFYVDLDTNTAGNEYNIWHLGNFDPNDVSVVPKKFNDLQDTPADKTGYAGKYVRVAQDEQTLIYSDVPDEKAIWGNITGTLSNQTDLNSALDSKYDKTGGLISGNVEISGGTVLQGLATLNGALNANGSAVFGDVVTFNKAITAVDIATFKENVLFEKDISVTGSLNITGNAYFNDDIQTAKDVTIAGTLGVSLAAVFQNDVSIQNDLNVQLSSNFQGEVHMYNGMVVTGASILNDKLTVNNDVDITGLTRINNQLQVQQEGYFLSDVSVNTDLTVNGSSSLVGDVVAGANVTVTDNLNVLKQSNFNQDAHFLADIDVQGATLLVGDVTTSNSVGIGTALDVGTDAIIGNALTVNGLITGNNSLNIAGNGTFGGDGSFDGSLIVDLNANISGNSTVTGNSDVGGTLTVGGLVTLNNNLTLSGNAAVGGTLSIGSTSTFNDDVTIDTSLAVGTDLTVGHDINVSNNIAVGSNVDINQNLTVTNTTTLSGLLIANGATTVDNTLTVNQLATLSGGLQVNGDSALNGNLAVTGTITEAGDRVATLDSTGKLKTSQLPALSITSVHVVADIAARDQLVTDGVVQEGDVAKVTDSDGNGRPQTYILDGSNQWIDIQETSDVMSVNGYTGDVVLTTTDISEGSNLYYTDARVDARISASSINALVDVDTATTAPQVNDTFEWDGTNWVPTARLSNAETDISNLQAELDATQTGAGLGSDGSYTADANTNYLSGATDLFEADIILDTQIKVNADNIATNTTSISDEVTRATNAETALQTELDVTQTGAGLGIDGSYTADATTNYINGATDLFNADVLLDAAVKANADAISLIKFPGKENFTGDGTTTDFTISGKVFTIGEMDAYLDGVMQLDDGTIYTVSDNGTDTTISFATAPGNGVWVRINYFA